MRKIQFVFLMSILVLAFQNCTETKSNSEEATSSGSTDLGNSNLVNAKSEELAQVQKVEIELPAQPVSRADVVANNQKLDRSALLVTIDIESKEIEISDSESGQLIDNQKRCLSADEKEELLSILQTADLCKAKDQQTVTNDGQLCTALYKAPYASLIKANGDDLRLGEAFNGCEVKQDLCGDHSSMLKGFIQHLRATAMSARACR
ncbi:MAG: hypothetical protein ACOYOK_15835 [Pseudobdellovibrionaceae bacterium]